MNIPSTPHGLDGTEHGHTRVGKVVEARGQARASMRDLNASSGDWILS